MEPKKMKTATWGCLGIISIIVIAAIFLVVKLIDFMVTPIGGKYIDDDEAICITDKSYNYRDFCSNYEFEKAHNVLDALYAQYTSAQKKSGENTGSYRDRKKKYKTQYHDALDYIFNKEALYLFSLEDEQANKRITYLLTEIPVEGTQPSFGDRFSDEDSEETDIRTNPAAVAKYKYYEFVTDYNIKCSQLLDLAIANNNKSIAKKLLSMFKKDVIISNYKYEFSNKSKNDAKSKYDAFVFDYDDDEYLE